jgi:flavin reductase (DIM6/NTAB) family NADH-FMN oxidoreductase RutF
MHLPASRVITPSILYFGTPVALISTVCPQGRPNLTPISSAWALGDRVLLGMACASQGSANLLATREAVINLPGSAQQAAIEMLAPTTGRNPVPAHKADMGYRFEPDKFGLAGLTALPALEVAPRRVAECPLQLEARLLRADPATVVEGAADPQFMTLEMQVLRVHAHDDIMLPDTQHVDTQRWSPLLYVFRHYFGTGPRLGRNFRAQT